MKIKIKRLQELALDVKGETLIEVVTSLALFAVTMVLVATLFTSANRILAANIQTGRQMNAQLNQLTLEEDLTVVNHEQPLKLSFEYADPDKNIKTAEAKLELVTPKDQATGFAKYRIKP